MLTPDSTAPTVVTPSKYVECHTSSSKLSRSRTADLCPGTLSRKETLLDREYNRVFKKSTSTSSSPDPAHSSDGSAPSPVPTQQQAPLPRCATSQEIKDLYTNRRNSWRGSQQELVPAGLAGDLMSQRRDPSSHECVVQRPDVIPPQCPGSGRASSPEPGGSPQDPPRPDPWIPRGPTHSSTFCQGFQPLGQQEEKVSSSRFVRGGSVVSSHSDTPKSPSRFFHSPKFLKKFASSTREGLSNMLRSPRTERKKLTSERDMYGSPKFSRSAGVRLLKSTSAAAAAPSEVLLCLLSHLFFVLMREMFPYFKGPHILNASY